MGRNICCQKTWNGCAAVRFQPSALWHSASLLLGSKPLNDLSDKSLFAGYMNASSVCWPLKASQSILVSKRGRLQSSTAPRRRSARLIATYILYYYLY
jgi:hypothetical protein